MIRIRKGIVKKVINKNNRITVIEVLYDRKVEKAINYNFLTGKIFTGDIVYINTSANYLRLGTGGYNFVIINETRGSNVDINNSGHIMKLRYTPYQIKCNCASEETNRSCTEINTFKDLNNAVVITGELHSMLSPTACTLKYLNRDLNIVYIMTDGGSLPIDISFTVDELKRKKVIKGTVTAGNAFGGDMEAVNIFDAIIIAYKVLECDIAIVTMGPGIVGTNTKYGFTGIEQGQIIDCINTLKGIPVFIPRMSFKDLRKRHYGISHHTLTVLSQISKTSSNVIFPMLGGDKMDYIKSQINMYDINIKHKVEFINCITVFEALEHFKVTVNTMGRSIHEDKEFFLACSGAAYYANSILNRFIRQFNSY